MELYVRSLDVNDDIKQIFELCKQNNLNSAYYTTNFDSWNLQYVNNPINKAWNSVLINKDDNHIHGHIGLSPQLIRAYGKDWTAGLINNGVVSVFARNKLIPYNNIKTFAITPLIDNCVIESFKDKIDFTIANTTIHPLIWKNLKFKTINVERKTTIHTNFNGLLRGYHALIKKFNNNKFFKFFHLPYITFIILVQYLSNISFRKENKNIVVKKNDSFGYDFDILFKEFYDLNNELITCKRDIDFLNWKFRNNHFKTYEFRFNLKLIGYVILEKSNTFKQDPGYTVVDCVVLNDYLKYCYTIFKKIISIEKSTIIFIHYLSSDYTNKLFKNIKKSGFIFSTHPLRILGIDKRKRHITSTLYYRINDQSYFNKLISDKSINWFITPILFNPGFCD